MLPYTLQDKNSPITSSDDAEPSYNFLKQIAPVTSSGAAAATLYRDWAGVPHFDHTKQLFIFITPKRSPLLLRQLKMKKFFVYILLCADETYYVGVTSDLEKRIHRHKTSYYEGAYT
ncbi:MAG: GIY-YIG nuclease family protein [Crocinitomicaceae bacterium]